MQEASVMIAREIEEEEKSLGVGPDLNQSHFAAWVAQREEEKTTGRQSTINRHTEGADSSQLQW